MVEAARVRREAPMALAEAKTSAPIMTSISSPRVIVIPVAPSSTFEESTIRPLGVS